MSYFLENPGNEIHLKELARTLKISPATAKTFCDLFTQENIVTKKQKSNSLFFQLNNENRYVQQLKKVYFLLKIKKIWKEVKEEGIKSIVLYGSFSSGRYGEKSDLDILILSRKKEIDTTFVLDFQKKMKKEINITKITYIEWEKLKKENDPFLQEVMLNHFIIQGEEL